MSKFMFSYEAVKDLEEIWSYTKQIWSIEQADRYYQLILDEVTFISSNPKLGRSIDNIKSGYRATTVKSNVIYYRQIEDEVIFIVRILHQRMDIESKMK